MRVNFQEVHFRGIHLTGRNQVLSGFKITKSPAILTVHGAHQVGSPATLWMCDGKDHGKKKGRFLESAFSLFFITGPVPGPLFQERLQHLGHCRSHMAIPSLF